MCKEQESKLLKNPVAPKVKRMENLIKVLNLTPDEVKTLLKTCGATIQHTICKDLKHSTHMQGYICLNQTLQADLAKNPYLDEELAWELTKSLNKNVKAALGTNQHINPKILERLSLDSEERVRMAIGSNPKTPAGVLEDLFKETASGMVTGAILSNPNTPTHVLQTGAKNSKVAAKILLASNPKIPIDVVKSLIEQTEGEKPPSQEQGSNYVVLEVLFSNPAAKKHRKEILKKFKEIGTDESIKYLVGSGATEPEDLEYLISLYPEMKEELTAANPETPFETLTVLSNTTNYQVLMNLASNPHTPENVLVKLTQSKVRTIVEALASRPNISPKIEAEILKTQDSMVRHYLSRNRNTIKETKLALIH